MAAPASDTSDKDDTSSLEHIHLDSGVEQLVTTLLCDEALLMDFDEKLFDIGETAFTDHDMLTLLDIDELIRDDNPNLNSTAVHSPAVQLIDPQWEANKAIEHDHDYCSSGASNYDTPDL